VRYITCTVPHTLKRIGVHRSGVQMLVEPYFDPNRLTQKDIEFFRDEENGGQGFQGSFTGMVTSFVLSLFS